MTTFSGSHSTMRGWLCAAQWRTLRTILIFTVSTGTGLFAAGAGGRAQMPPQPAMPGYHGIWFDDTGDGAIEITPCADRLCGKIVWLKAPLDRTGRPLTDGNNPDARQRQRPICGLPVIGNLKRQSGDIWDEGWIYDPKEGKQYDVELRLRARDALQVTGYLGVKFLSETFVWKRAPADLKKCA